MPKIQELRFRWRNDGLEAWLDVQCGGISHEKLSWNILVAKGTTENCKLIDNPFHRWDPRSHPTGQARYVVCYRKTAHGGRRPEHRVFLDDEYADIKEEVLRKAREFIGIEASTPTTE